MYIHIIGLCYILYAFDLMLFIQTLANPKLRTLSIFSLFPVVYIAIEFVTLLLQSNPLAELRYILILVVHTFAIASVGLLMRKEDDPEVVGKLSWSMVVGIFGLILGIGIGYVQLNHPPEAPLIYW
jgi:hypothetical protein